MPKISSCGIIDLRLAVVEVANLYQTSQLPQTTLRSVLGEVELDELLAHRDKINTRLQSIRVTQLLGRLPGLSTYRQPPTSRGPQNSAGYNAKGGAKCDLKSFRLAPFGSMVSPTNTTW